MPAPTIRNPKPAAPTRPSDVKLAFAICRSFASMLNRRGACRISLTVRAKPNAKTKGPGGINVYAPLTASVLTATSPSS